jgi:WD40 repeat protein/class 3 adenylate cyclase/tRNA A-37 threonylcarbamoyl transferase component Bud32/energy-coupling factor transporter ATP-binding protein EcfA2
MATLIRERYQVLSTLGAGGEARVVKALDRQHDRVVALKIRHVWDGQTRDDLLNEARILLAVPPHPALPLVREDFFDDEDYVVAMDWVDGTDLARLLADRGRPGLAPSSVLAYLSDAAEALTHLHAQAPPVIHGDLKPGNLILTTGGRVKLVDFGMSSAPNALRRRSGTPGYRAPELAAGDAPSRAGDIYALAATAFALLTGAAPAGTLPSWEGIDPAQAEQLEAAIRMGMATDPARRPSSPGEMVERLRAGWVSAMPTGVVTFCMSDIEGSTAMWESHPTAMAQALVRHDELLADCTAVHGGRLIGSMGEGDSTVSVFNSAPDAVAAALDATRALAAERWPEGARITARFGLHTGEADRRGASYVGPAINLAARLRGQATGGQVFLSSVTADLARSHLPEDCSLVDLGPHRLAGVAAPERVHALKGRGVSTPLPATECPYRGLLAFEAEDRAFFFGREAVVADLIGRLAPGQLLAVVGASGSGKSSVLRAGVMAAVEAGEVPGIDHAHLMTPGARPQPPRDTDSGALLVVDQFEELFTLCHDANVQVAFIDALLARPGPALIGVRADMYGRLAAHPDLARAVATHQILLGAMSDAELQRAVVEPAHLAGLRLDPGLVELAVREVAGEPGALPLLSHALRATWERRDGRTLTVEGYRESGGVGAAVAQTADEALAALPPLHQQLVRNVFVRLTDLGDDRTATRRRVRIEELVPQGVAAQDVQALLEGLADARLLTLGEDTAEVAHEVLIREWPTLRIWLEEDREGLRLHRQLGDAARMWEVGGRDPSDLYRGPRLLAATDWEHAHRPELNAVERSFIDAGVAEADRERRAQARANRRLRVLLAGAVGLLLVAIAAGAVALVQRHDARAQALTSDAERIGAQALTEQQADRSMLLAVAGVKLQNRAETRSDLFADLQQNAALIQLIRPSKIEVTALRVSPDGRLLAVGDASGTVRFIDLHTWKPSGAVLRLEDPVGERALSFSPDGRTLMAVAIGGGRSELYSIDVARRQARRVRAWSGAAPQPPIGFDAVAYSPDGAEVAVTHDVDPVNGNGITPTRAQLLVFDAATGHVKWQRRYPLASEQGDPHVIFAPGGTLLTSAQQGTTLIWDARTGRVLRRFSLGGLPAIAPDGHTVALAQNSPDAGDQSSAVTLLDLRTGRRRTLLATLPDHWIRSLAFTPDGTQLAGAATDGLHVWQVASGKITDSYATDAGPHTLSALDPGGRTLIAGQQDGTIAAYDLGGERRLGRTFKWNVPKQGCGYTPCMAINRQSPLMAADQNDGTVAIVNLRTLRHIRTLPARDGSISAAIAFTPDGRTLITGGVNRHVTVWDVATGRVIRTLRFADPVWSVTVSPDGKLLGVQTWVNNSPVTHVLEAQLATGKVLRSHVVPYGPDGVEFSPNGRELFALGCCWTGSGSALNAWDAQTGRQLFRLGDSLGAGAFDASPDSRRLAVGTAGGALVLLDARSGKRIGPPMQAAGGVIAGVSFSSDGRSVAISSDDHTTSIWDLRTHSRVGNPFGPYTDTVPATFFTPDGHLVIGLEGSAIEWPVDPRSWERFACQVAGRDLTRAEWHAVLPNRPYQRVCPGNR